MNYSKIICEIGENCYLYENDQKDCLIIDPGSHGQLIIQAIEEKGLNPLAILITHGHFDHIGALDEVRDHFNIQCYVHKFDQEFLVNPVLNGSAKYIRSGIVVKEADHIIDNECTLEIGDFVLQVIHTPGHSPGGVCYYDPKAAIVFAGDTLFQQSIGRTDLVGGSYEELINSIKAKLLKLPDATIALPGHGEETTIGQERASNPFLQ